jgi:hypothetical protein
MIEVHTRIQIKANHLLKIQMYVVVTFTEKQIYLFLYLYDRD